MRYYLLRLVQALKATHRTTQEVAKTYLGITV